MLEKLPHFEAFFVVLVLRRVVAEAIVDHQLEVGTKGEKNIFRVTEFKILPAAELLAGMKQGRGTRHVSSRI
jgi:hypothetical protein